MNLPKNLWLSPSSQSPSKPNPQGHTAFIIRVALICITLAGLILLFGGYHGLFLSINHLGNQLLPASFWSVTTLLGDTYVALALLLFFVYRFPSLLPATLLASIPSTIVSHGLKALFNMDRPASVLDSSLFHQIGPALHHGSFPSGHSTTVGVFIAMMLFISTTRWQRIFWLIVMCLVPLSRVVVGAHWPIDTLMGLALGLLCGCWGIRMTCRYRFAQKISSQWLLIALPLIAAISCLHHDGGYHSGHLFISTIAVFGLIYYIRQLTNASGLRKPTVQAS